VPQVRQSVPEPKMIFFDCFSYPGPGVAGRSSWVNLDRTQMPIGNRARPTRFSLRLDRLHRSTDYLYTKSDLFANLDSSVIPSKSSGQALRDWSRYTLIPDLFSAVLYKSADRKS
jgi:hypothetical protein